MRNRVIATALCALLMVSFAGLYLLQAPTSSADTCSYYWQPEYRAKVIDGTYQCASGTQDCTECEDENGDTCAEDGMKFCDPEFFEKTMSP